MEKLCCKKLVLSPSYGGEGNHPHQQKGCYMIQRSLLSTLALVATLIAPAAVAEKVHASWYGTETQFHGNPMASGPRFDMRDPQMAAHKTLPFCTQVKLRNPENGKELGIIIMDRGPSVPGRDFDLSQAAARELGYFSKGVTQLQVLEIVPPRRKHQYGQPCDMYLG